MCVRSRSINAQAGNEPEEGGEAVKAMTVDDAIVVVMREAPSEIARTYARAAMTAAVRYGTAGLRVQVRYILSNTRGWKGERAREVKVVLMAYLNEGR